MALALRLETSQPSFVSGEAVTLRVHVENVGSEAVTVLRAVGPHHATPVFTVRGPALPPAGDVFNLWERASGGTGVPPFERAIPVTLGPGESSRSSFDLARRTSLAEPGRYTVAAHYAWAGMQANAAEIAFEIEPLRPLAPPSAGVGVGPHSEELFVAVLQESASGPVLLRAGFTRFEPDHCMRPYACARSPVSHEAVDALSAASGFKRTNVFFDWLVSRETSSLAALAPGAAAPLRLELAPGERVVAPPLLLAGHELDAFVLSGTTLSLARFHDPERSSAEPARLWSLELPSAPLAAVAAPDPRETDRRHVAWLEAKPSRLACASVVGTAEPETIGAWDVEGVEPLPGGGPALAAVGATARVGLAARSLDDPRRASLLEGVASLPSQEPRGLATIAVAELPCAAKAARVAYLALADGRVLRAWVVEGEDGRLYATTRARGPARVVRERAELERSSLVVLPAGAYLLVAPPVGGLRLEPLS